MYIGCKVFGHERREIVASTSLIGLFLTMESLNFNGDILQWYLSLDEEQRYVDKKYQIAVTCLRCKEVIKDAIPKRY